MELPEDRDPARAWLATFLGGVAVTVTVGLAHGLGYPPAGYKARETGRPGDPVDETGRRPATPSSRRNPHVRSTMQVTVDVAGEDTHELELELEDPTYADLVRAVELNPHEVSVLVDGRPVPEDQPVEADEVRVLRLVKGGAVDAG